MAKTRSSRASNDYDKNDSDDSEYSSNSEVSEPRMKTYELRLWPPPSLQAYCVDHFLTECEIYYEQENERYNKLVGHSRENFLAKQRKPSKPPLAPTRRQPSRRAKEKALSSEAITKPKGPPRPKMPSSAPFKPEKLERAFRDSQEGTSFRILSAFRKKLDLHKSWEEFRSALEEVIQKTADALKMKIEKDAGAAHANCLFGGPLGIQCRYCGFEDTVQDEVELTPRKLAPPAAMHQIKPGELKEKGVEFQGIQFIVDVCGGNVHVVLGTFRGVLDLCAELLRGGPVPESPTSLAAYLIRNERREIRSTNTERHPGGTGSERGRKRRKTALGS
ncbi:hypothetical protein F5Y19DRAFT_485168 [Xylariaceae sp. FL1651]|nr:hypothetical protein F5Y19DRAFT_485168 [Xylariaceae sp. FL1651]